MIYLVEYKLGPKNAPWVVWGKHSTRKAANDWREAQITAIIGDSDLSRELVSKTLRVRGFR